MLSLNSLTPSPDARPVPEVKAKPPNENGSDFAAYIVALAQPVKVESQQSLAQRPAEAVAAEKPPVSQPAATTEAPAQGTQQAQKAGHDAPAEVQSGKEARVDKETTEVKAVKAEPIRSEKDLLETLGLTARKAAPKQVTETAKVQSSITSTEEKYALYRAQKNRDAASTLVELQKAPDLILGNSEGLRRLGEKLGLAFLGKMSDKLSEKQPKADSTQTATKAEVRAEPGLAVTTTRPQKAGHEAADQNPSFQNAFRQARSAPVKPVSRETMAAETTEKPAPIGGNDLKPVSIPETGTGRIAITTTDTRLGDSVAHLRANDNVRAAVENPMVRADLMRQFSEVMSRAQVLVTDSQNAQFSVKLFPREIGRMEIDLKMVEGEIRGKIVVESEDVKNEMQNYLQQRDQSPEGAQIDLNKIDIEVRSGNRHAQNPERTPDADTLMQNLVTRAATSAYEISDSMQTAGTALYA